MLRMLPKYIFKLVYITLARGMVRVDVLASACVTELSASGWLRVPAVDVRLCMAWVHQSGQHTCKWPLRQWLAMLQWPRLRGLSG